MAEKPQLRFSRFVSDEQESPTMVLQHCEELNPIEGFIDPKTGKVNCEGKLDRGTVLGFEGKKFMVVGFSGYEKDIGIPVVRALENDQMIGAELHITKMGEGCYEPRESAITMRYEIKPEQKSVEAVQNALDAIRIIKEDPSKYKEAVRALSPEVLKEFYELLLIFREEFKGIMIDEDQGK